MSKRARYSLDEPAIGSDPAPAEEDHFSSLSEDCILAIMKNLSSVHLGLMAQASVQLNMIANRKCLRVEKKKARSLRLRKTLEGAEIGAFFGLSGCLFRPVEQKDLIYEETTTVSFASFSYRFLEKLRFIIDKATFSDQISFVGFWFSDVSFRDLVWSCRATSNSFNLSYCSFVGCNKATANLLARFVLSTKVRDLKLVNCDLPYAKLSDRSFMESFSADPTYNAYVIVVKHQTVPTDHWTPDRSFLPTLARFSLLQLRAIKFDAALLAEAILMRANTVSGYAGWKFSITAPLSEEQIGQQFGQPYQVFLVDGRCKRLQPRYNVHLVTEEVHRIVCTLHFDWLKDFNRMPLFPIQYEAHVEIFGA